MNEYEIPNEELLKSAKQIFSEISLAEEILTPSNTASAVSLSQLVAYANGVANDLVERRLNEDLKLRRVYRDILQKTSVYYVSEALAASSDEILDRHGTGCRIRMEPSRAEPDQVYVIIELTGNEKVQPTTLVVCDIEANCSRFPLPNIRDGVAQIITSREADLVRLLSDPKTEAFIR